MLLIWKKATALSNFNKDQAFRFWAASHGGLYVPVDENLDPSEYLAHVEDRDVVTSSGKMLTLVNPAFMLRLLFEDYSKLYGINGHITSLNPLRPGNEPDTWERKTLESFNQGKPEVFEITVEQGEKYVRFMKPMFTQEDCLKCHAHQGYKVGDVRGGVSVSLPLKPFLDTTRKSNYNSILSHLAILFSGILMILIFSKRIKNHVVSLSKAQESLQKAHNTLEIKVIERTATLQKALDEVNTLKEIIPICSFCKQIRDDEGYWNQLEDYIHTHTGSQFSHGICPECIKKHYPEFADAVTDEV